MADERKPVMCPWCGWDMVAREGQDIFHGKYHFYVCEGCEATSPIAYSEDTACAAATKRPPNRPLTPEQNEITRIHLLQYESLRKNFYALIESVLGEDYYNLGMDVYTCDAMACEDIANKIGAKWIAQPADIEAARKERT